MTTPRSPAASRRAFLLGVGAMPLGAAAAGFPRDDADDMAAAARLAGLEFTPEERTLAKKVLAEQRNDYAAMRQQTVPFELPPCASFDPLPVGQVRAEPVPRVPFPIRPDVALPADETDLAFLSVAELASLLRTKRVTSQQLTELYLRRLAKFDPQLSCVVTLLREQALERAKTLDAELQTGRDRGPLHGIPYGAKDLFGWPGAPTTFGAAPWKDHHWAVEATCLRRLHDAGAVLVAKLSLGALAMGDLWHGGRTRNPYNPEQGSSGSSAGPASAVAAGLVPFAIGTETLGSIVSPCRTCGIAGLRPTFGTVSRHGAMPLSWTMDKVGPIARTAVDAALVFDAMRGADGKDPSVRDSHFAWQPGRSMKGLRIGIVQERERGQEWPRREDEKAFVAWLTENGAAPVPVQLPSAPYRALLTMLDAEAATAFDEFLRQGHLGELPGQREGDWPNQFRTARTIPAVEYLRASRLRTKLCADMHATMAPIDVLVASTGSTLRCTNLTGHPTYVLPTGISEPDGGRPTMVSLIGRLYGEGEVLTVAENWQNATQFHLARPALTR
ncbi:MAG TPA: amidase [Planctomycetota bacterium]|nr:amidase [Planctomycetota bacterium]